MVSISKIGMFNSNPVRFSANSQFQNKTTDRAKLENYADKQVRLGYATMSLAGLAAVGATLKTHRIVRAIATIPAVMATAMLGANLMSSGYALKKVANAPQPQQVETKK